jgi:hypothetical protein
MIEIQVKVKYLQIKKEPGNYLCYCKNQFIESLNQLKSLSLKSNYQNITVEPVKYHKVKNKHHFIIQDIVDIIMNKAAILCIKVMKILSKKKIKLFKKKNKFKLRHK